ncbi:hypothetical protein D3C86_1288640 [compost metagenome]
MTAMLLMTVKGSGLLRIPSETTTTPPLVAPSGTVTLIVVSLRGSSLTAMALPKKTCRTLC